MRKRGGHSAKALTQHREGERDMYVTVMLGEMEAYLKGKWGEGVEVSCEEVVGEASGNTGDGIITKRHSFEEGQMCQRWLRVRKHVRGFVHVVHAGVWRRCIALLVADGRQMEGDSTGETRRVSEPEDSFLILWQNLDGNRKCAWVETQPQFFSPN